MHGFMFATIGTLHCEFLQRGPACMLTSQTAMVYITRAVALGSKVGPLSGLRLRYNTKIIEPVIYEYRGHPLPSES